MIKRPNTNAQRLKRHKRVRSKISGTPERPRLNVFRSETNIYAQIIDDVTGKTLVSASSLEKDFSCEGTKSDAAKQVGINVAERAKAKGIETVVFDRGGYVYHGRVKALAEGAREGGFPTQRTADAAATRLCDCEEAVANRAPVIGVAMAVTTGACRYCGQIQEVGPHPSQAAADDTATEVCNCPTARQERRVHEQVADACERVQRLFGDDAESLGFKPIPDEAVGLLENVVEMIARGPISSASLNVRGRCKAKFSVTSKGKIKVSRSETRSCDLEDGE